MIVEPPLPAEDLALVLRATAPLWPELRGARLLITGGTGFFGRWILESLLAANAEWRLGIHATVLSRAPGEFLKRVPHLASVTQLKWVTGSVATCAPELFAGDRYSGVIHLATEADGRATLTAPLAAIDVIANGTGRVLEVARRTGASRFLFASSGSVYGLQPPEVELIPEDFPGAPDPTDMTGAYAISGAAKRHAELLCAAYAQEHGLGTVIARGFTFAGPGLPLDGKFAFGNFLQDALAGRPIVITGDGTPIRSYLHAIDLTTWLWTMLVRGSAGCVYNLGSENAVSLCEVASAIARELGSPGVTVLQTSRLGAVPHRYVPSTRRARDELSLRETIGLKDAIRLSAAWHRTMGKH